MCGEQSGSCRGRACVKHKRMARFILIGIITLGFVCLHSEVIFRKFKLMQLLMDFMIHLLMN